MSKSVKVCPSRLVSTMARPVLRPQVGISTSTKAMIYSSCIVIWCERHCADQGFQQILLMYVLFCKNRFVECRRTHGNNVPGELALNSSTSGAAHLAAEVGRGEQLIQALGQSFRAARWHKEACLAILNRKGEAANG